MKVTQDLLALKDKILTLCLWPSLGLAELTFKAMHWTTEARLKTAVGNMLCKSSRYVHFKHTGTHPIDEIMKDAAASRHRKKRS